MKTQELLDKLNSVITEKFKEYIGKPRQNFGDCHKIVEGAIRGLLPVNLEYGIWKIKPVDIEREHDIDVLFLDTEGKFEKYKNSNGWKKQGKWLSIPQYIATEKEDTIEGIIQKKQLALFKQDLQQTIEYRDELQTKLVENEEHIKRLKEKIKILS